MISDHLNRTFNPAHPDQLIARLDALGPGKQQQKAERFHQIYPGIEGALARCVPQKLILAELAKAGLTLSLGGFRSLLEAERNKRTTEGGEIRCKQCGSHLGHDPGESKLPSAEPECSQDEA